MIGNPPTINQQCKRTQRQHRLSYQPCTRRHCRHRSACLSAFYRQRCRQRPNLHRSACRQYRQRHCPRRSARPLVAFAAWKRGESNLIDSVNRSRISIRSSSQQTNGSINDRDCSGPGREEREEADECRLTHRYVAERALRGSGDSKDDD